MLPDLNRSFVIRWSDPDPKWIPLLKEASLDGVLLEAPNENFQRACQESGIQTALAGEVRLLKLEKVDRTPGSGPIILESGQWPGISRGPNVEGTGDETASASREPWVDSNGYLVSYLRALFPGRPTVLGYQPGEASGLKPDRLVPFDSLELALVEAWVAGGNYLLALEPRYREALLRGDAKALAAWRQLGRTADWLRRYPGLFQERVFPMITALVEPGGTTAEIANLLHRWNASPALADAADPPAPEPGRCLALVAAGIRPPRPEARARILVHAESGGFVITDAPGENVWWRHPRLRLLREEDDRSFFALGPGQIVAYKKRIADPSEFALDVIDIITHKRRAVRLWKAPAVVALARFCPHHGRVRGEALLAVVNYGSPVDTEIQTRIQGNFAKALLLRPEAPPVTLRAVKRGATTEIMVPELTRVAAVIFG
jgi:hypothetical protein